MMYPPPQRIHAPELRADFWFNTSPLSIQDAAGSAFLLAFWDYASAASLELISVVKEWHRRYAGVGLHVIGIHSPEFDFGREAHEVETAIRALKIDFPVATDNTRSMLYAYQVQQIPTVVLIGRDGSIYSVFGGLRNCDQVERSIHVLLREMGNYGELPTLLGQLRPEEPAGYQRPSPAMRTGYLHGALGNMEGYSPELPAQYLDRGYQVEGKFYIEGKWIARVESLEFCGDEAGHLVFRYVGRSVQAVLGSHTPGAVVEIRHDGLSLTPLESGNDVLRSEDGTTTVVIDRPKLYQIVALQDIEEHQLMFIPLTEGVSFYSITFEWHSALAAGPSESSPIFTN